MKQSTQKSPKERHVILYFQVHQPRRLRKLGFLDVGRTGGYFDDNLNEEIISRVSENCYLPVNEKLRKLTERFPGIKLCFSLSGVLIDQLERYKPEALKSFKQLSETGAVEFLSETYYHSLSSLTPNEEFIIQVNAHRQLMQDHFGVSPEVFRNTELIYSNSIGSKVAQLGFKGILCDGIGRTLEGRSPYQLFKHPAQERFDILLRSNGLSDDIAFRFEQDRKFSVDEFTQWIYDIPGDNSIVTLGMDYETFGEHHKESTGIISFLEKLIGKLHTDGVVKLTTPSPLFKSQVVKEKLDIYDFVSWADESKDISAWLGNDIQCDAFKTLQSMEDSIMNTHNREMIDTWRNLQTSDHFYYMSTKVAQDGNVHSYFSHYGSPYEAFINYMNTLTDLSVRARNRVPMNPAPVSVPAASDVVKAGQEQHLLTATV
jgi:alpha-amylase